MTEHYRIPETPACHRFNAGIHARWNPGDAERHAPGADRGTELQSDPCEYIPSRYETRHRSTQKSSRSAQLHALEERFADREYTECPSEESIPNGSSVICGALAKNRGHKAICFATSALLACDVTSEEADHIPNNARESARGEPAALALEKAWVSWL